MSPVQFVTYLSARTSLSGHCVYATSRYQRLKQPGLRSRDADLAFCDLDALCQRAQVIAAIAPQVVGLSRLRGLEGSG
ncbi:hypothetical protein [Ciceribacter sp. RN22]|uniref:hypothetical protein n=1 Tax=Ciceribacter sp. RN22 TaxID=2954932 RepID=UPI0020922447|nr:hypothetical protein [Ciceribacter sp. RN22]MCO6178446.1 hypothetical protein [Ciceribacter sp. RN22]